MVALWQSFEAFYELLPKIIAFLHSKGITVPELEVKLVLLLEQVKNHNFTHLPATQNFLQRTQRSHSQLKTEGGVQCVIPSSTFSCKRNPIFPKPLCCTYTPN